jgi:hypothetical protein
VKLAPRHVRKRVSPRAGLHSSTMEGLMGAAKDAMGGGEAPPHDPAEAEAPRPRRNIRRRR